MTCRTFSCILVPKLRLGMGDWKLIEFFEDGTLELYNTAQDPAEANDLAGTMPQKVRQMHDVLAAWRKDVAAPVPTEPNPRYDPKASWSP